MRIAVQREAVESLVGAGPDDELLGDGVEERASLVSTLVVASQAANNQQVAGQLRPVDEYAALLHKVPTVPPRVTKSSSPPC